MIRSVALRTCRAWTTASTKANITTNTTPMTPNSTQVERHFPHSATSIQPAEEEGLKWRFPVDVRTQAMATSVERGLSQTATLTFNSKAPITPDLMEEALIHLYDKIESLRLCVRHRHGQQLWLADMPKRKLDFQIVSGPDPLEEHYALDKSPFNLHEGPLWKVRLMQCPPDAPCAFPEVKAAFPHQYNFLISLNHAFNDGLVMITIQDVLFRILDNLLEGSPVDTKPIGELRDGVEVREEENRIREDLENDPHRLTEALRKYSMSKHLPILMEAYGVPDEANPSTKYLPPVLLDNQMMKKIAAKTRSIGVTLNSCFTAVLNVSMMEVAREAGLERDTYNISSRLPVDSRRLMKNCKSLPLGFHSMPILQCTSTPHDAKKNFWQYVKHLDTEMREKLKGNYMCEQRVLEAILRREGFMPEATQHLPDCDYLFSNLYSPKVSEQKDVGKNIQITEGGNYMTTHSERIAVPQGVFVTRGQARLQIGYSTSAINGKVAKRCLEKNVAMFHDVSKTID